MRLLALTALFLTACPDVCERGEAIARSFPERHQACIEQETLPSSPAFDKKACETSMKVCTPKDEQALHTYFDCVEKLPVCTRASQEAFNEKYLECAGPMLTLTEGCFRP